MHNIKLNEYEYVKITMKTPKIWPIINADINIKGIVQHRKAKGRGKYAITFLPRETAEKTNAVQLKCVSLNQEIRIHRHLDCLVTPYSGLTIFIFHNHKRNEK